MNTCLKWVKKLMLYVLFIPIILYTKLYVMCTEKWFLTVSLQAICYIWTQTTWVLMHTGIYFKCQVNSAWPNTTETEEGEVKTLSHFLKMSRSLRGQHLQGCGWCFLFCWSFLSKNPLSLKVASQLLNHTVTFSSRKYSESYQMLLGAQRGTSLSSSVMVQLFPHRGILANLSILRTKKNI